MTPSDAAALAVLGLHDRRLVTALIRAAAGRATAEDLEALPERRADETLLGWGCRSRSAPGRPPWPEELARLMREAQHQLATAARLDVTPVAFGEPQYPALLAAIPDPPPMLWVRGRVDVLSAPAVAIVGSRAATPYGMAMARQLSIELTAAGVVVVSGLARGVDSSAHVAAVSAGGRTVGVLGCGVDRVYPSEHKGLARDMEAAGAVASEFPPGVPPLPHHFPLRNRIISGLSLAVVVVEAPEKSGALITASAAAEQGRDVMVVPGPALGGRNRGGHLLIRDGAKVVESANDILQELEGWRAAYSRSAGAGATLGQLPEAADFTIDEVAAETGEPTDAVLARLLELELMGRIQRIGGGRFVRVLT